MNILNIISKLLLFAFAIVISHDIIPHHHHDDETCNHEHKHEIVHLGECDAFIFTIQKRVEYYTCNHFTLPLIDTKSTADNTERRAKTIILAAPKIRSEFHVTAPHRGPPAIS
ncbi:MAG: hypothetical protein ACKVJ6_03295 [Flavobacteriales bacterium]